LIRVFAALALAACALACGASEEPQTLGTGSVKSEMGSYTLSIEPRTKIRRGANDFVVKTLLPSGTRIERASSFMPSHGHGGELARLREDDGAIAIEDMLLYMPGRWEVTLDLQGAKGKDALRFSVDVP
jgi:hypothetical protein